MLTQDLASHTAAQAELQDKLYERVALRISELIEHGTLRPGERVPSVRKYSEQQDVSIATVMQAYRLLESRGLIEARPQSGYYVRTRHWTPAPEPEIYRPKPAAMNVKVSELVLQVIKAGRDPRFVKLGAALPSPEVFPTAELNRMMAAAGRRAPGESNSYSPPPGNPALRLQIARHAMAAGCTFSPDDIVITCGATEALNLCLRAVAKPGDVIAIESPTFFGVLQIIESLGMKVCEIPTYPREGICLDELETRLNYCRVKACVFSPNFANPLGSLMPDHKKQALVRMLSARRIPLIEDDICGNLAFDGSRPKVAKSFDTDGWVMLVESFTKTVAPGYRLGWVAPGRFKERVEFLKWVNTAATASLPQMGLAEFLKTGGYEHLLRKLRKFYAKQSRLMSAAICRHFPEGTKVSRPAGGMMLWVELPSEFDAMEIYHRALAEKITVAPR